MRLAGKAAIVTGGGKGIGRAISLAFAREGADVVLAARTESALMEVVSEIEAMGRRSLAVVTDICDSEQPLVMVDRAIETFGKVDVLVNNSGIAGPTIDVADIDLVAWKEVLAVNLTGAMLCTQHVLKRSMVPCRSGSIINITSWMGRRGYPSRSPYSTTKFGLIGFSQALAWEVGKLGIRVNCIAPGPVEGERMQRVLQARSKSTGIPFEEVLQTVKARSALGRVTKPDDVAALAVFLASDESSAITGQTISCCSGTWMG